MARTFAESEMDISASARSQTMQTRRLDGPLDPGTLSNSWEHSIPRSYKIVVLVVDGIKSTNTAPGC